VRVLDGHSKSINAAYCSPDGEVLVSVSQDNTIKAWLKPIFGVESADSSSSQWSKTNVPNISVKHDNHTGRWLSTFRPVFDVKQPAVFLTGSMDRPRRIEIFNVTDNHSTKPNVSLLKSLEAEYLGSVCSRNCFHPSLDIVVGGNSSGRVHIFR
jgi:WD repeat-containing protein 76